MGADLYVVGDSISIEPYAHAAVGWMSQLKAMAPRRLIDSYAIGGRAFTNMQPIAAALATANPRRIMAALGSNDINGGGLAANMILVAEIIRADCAAKGILFYLWTVPPCSAWGIGQNAQRAIFNAYARGLGGGCLDADALLLDPDAPNSLCPRFLIQAEPLDVIHPNSAGGRRLAETALAQMVLG